MAKQFDKEINTDWVVEYYNAEEVAEERRPLSETIMTSETFYKEPSLKYIEDKMIEKGYDTFEVIKSTFETTRYHVEDT